MTYTPTTEPVLYCGHPPSPHSDFTTGYGKDAAGRTYCYACCHARDLETMRTADRFTCYVGCDGRTLTTWTGEKLGTVTLGAVHPWSRKSPMGERHYLRAVDVYGGRWYGTGAPGMWASLRRVSGRATVRGDADWEATDSIVAGIEATATAAPAE